MDKKMISPQIEWYIGNVLVCAHFSSKLAHGTYCICYITQLFRLLGIVSIFSHVNAQTMLWWLKRLYMNILSFAILLIKLQMN